MTNPAKKDTTGTDKGSPRSKASELPDSDCEKSLPPKRVRLSGNSTEVVEGSSTTTTSDRGSTSTSSSTTTGLAATIAPGIRRVSPRREQLSDRRTVLGVDSREGTVTSTSGPSLLDWRQDVATFLPSSSAMTMTTGAGSKKSSQDGGDMVDTSSTTTSSTTRSPFGYTRSLDALKQTIEDKKKRNSSSIFKLDWVWSEKEVSDACMLVLDANGAQVFFHQDYSCGTAAARGTQPMSEGQHFWEIRMDSPVYGTAMMLGIGTKQIDLGQYTHTFCNMLGSDANSESCGLSYTGRFYQGGANGRAFCSKFGQGTVIGLHLDMWFGTLTYYKNGQCLGVATKGLLGKVWYPMISSTAARSSMCLQTARSFPSSLQFWCCRTLRRAIPVEHSVLEVLQFPPGMRAFLEDNLMWLLDSHCRGDVDVMTKGTQTDLSMATHQLNDVPLIRRPDATEDPPGEASPSS